MSIFFFLTVAFLGELNYLYKSNILTHFRNLAELFKGDLRHKLHHCFYSISLLKKPRTKFYGVLIGFQEVIKFCIQCKWCHNRECTKDFTSGFLCIFFVTFMEKKPIKFYCIFVHFSRTYEVAKFWIIKLYFKVTSCTRKNIQKMLILT